MTQQLPTNRKVKSMKALGALVGYVATILAANYVTTRYGMVPVGFGLEATAGTYLIGALFVLRDYIQDRAGKRAVFAAIAVGALLSFLVSDPFIAVASVTAFVVAEVIDFAIYTPLRKRGYIRAAVASNFVGSVLDTVVFLAVAGFPIAAAFTGQVVGKMAVTALVVLGVAAYRARRKLVVA